MENYLDYNNNGQTTFKLDDNKIKAKKLNQNGEYEKALKMINSIDDIDFETLNIKGMILTNLSRFSEAIDCFDNALSTNESDEIKLNKANALYEWAKVTFFPEADYFKATSLVNQALECIPESEDASELWFLKAEILEGQNDLVESYKCYLKAYKEFEKVEELEKQIEFLNNTHETLFIITGTSFYGDFEAECGMKVNLVREMDNEHDPDAIAVFKDSRKIGYVANNDYTLIKEVKSASDIKNSVPDEHSAEILFTFLGEYIVAKLA